MMTLRWATTVFFVGTVTASCGDDVRAPAALACQTTDSAGVALVMNGGSPSESFAGRSVAASPARSLGGGALEADESRRLSRVRDATMLLDGRVVVADGGSAQLRVFDSDGVGVEAWGRRGQGPGEFTGLAAVARWRGDSIAAWDMWQNRVSILDSNGAYGRSFSLLPSGESAPRVVDIHAEGTILAAVLPNVSPAERRTGPVRRSRTYVLLDDTGSLQTSLGVFPGSEGYVEYGEILMSWQVPFGRSTVAAFWGDEIVVGTNDFYEIRSYGANGTLHPLVRRSGDRRSPSQADLDAHVEGLLATLSPEDRALQAPSAARLPLVDAYPAYGSVKADARRYLWVEEYRLPDEERRRWSVYDFDGCVREVVDMPRDLEVFEIGPDYVLGKTQDELDVEQVQVWPLS